MLGFIEKWLIRFWNSQTTRRPESVEARGLDLGIGLVDGEPRGRLAIAQNKRAEHIAILGKTGSGKSFSILRLAQGDIRASRGFLWFDLHGDSTDFLLRCIAAEEAARKEDLSDRLILIDPADSEFSVGMNPLASDTLAARFVQVAEFAHVLRQRWHLESFGARTDELLRNALYTLAESGLTLLELAPLLTNAPFRASCLKKVSNIEVRQYFELRYDQLSPAFQATFREPILNKTSAFTADPHFRHIVGQANSRFSLIEALDARRWVIVNINKGRLGEQAPILAATLFTAAKNALFARQRRDLFTIYADEIQNLVAYGSEIETVLSEARKFGVSVVSANQFLDQYPPEMRAAIMAVGTQIFFQLSSGDANHIANALDGGKPLVELLKNLPRRHFVLKSGPTPWQEGIVPQVAVPAADPADLVSRSRTRWARSRNEVEAEIQQRQSAITRNASEALDDWE